ncbi:MAG TPA: dihydromethanopterin reductase (acceptor) [Methanobacterium sp.]|nr:dihydromethanopterin reductase (acceptor) [Methanobacterium sp.]HOI40984.1 dihydromethanopterin reductase (acceptor) [Methanobacterium sp.]
MKIAWAFTGAGHMLLESVETLEKIASEEKNQITVLLSGAGEEVLKMYGLFDRIKSLTGGYYQEMILEKDQMWSYPISGRFSLGRYDLLIVSPTTSNTIAKLVHGIADNLVTNAVAQAGKGKVRTILVPVDLESGDLDTVLPSKLELELCQNCDTCEAAAACPPDAITPSVEIDLLKCEGCAACQLACPYGAVSGGSIITIHMRKIDIENTDKLQRLEGVEVLPHPLKILEHI